MRLVLFRISRLISHFRWQLSSIGQSERHTRPARIRATILLMSAAMLLMVELGTAVAVRAQANIALSNAGVTGAVATNTNWSIAKRAASPPAPRVGR